MTLTYKMNKDIFSSRTDAIVNSVNCGGVMGKGIALQFKNRFPNMFEIYHERCRNHEVEIGRMDVYLKFQPKIINFPTKNNWREKSKLEYIKEGLLDFAANYKNWGIKSVAFPQLGTANGGLEWDDVKSLMEKFLTPLDLEVEIYVDNNSNLRNKLEKQIKELKPKDVSSISSFMDYYNQIKDNLVAGAYIQLDHKMLTHDFTSIIESKEDQNQFFDSFEEIVGKKVSEEEKIVILWKLYVLLKQKDLVTQSDNQIKINEEMDILQNQTQNKIEEEEQILEKNKKVKTPKKAVKKAKKTSKRGRSGKKNSKTDFETSNYLKIENFSQDKSNEN